jgi:hypothetical protein
MTNFVVGRNFFCNQDCNRKGVAENPAASFLLRGRKKRVGFLFKTLNSVKMKKQLMEKFAKSVIHQTQLSATIGGGYAFTGCPSACYGWVGQCSYVGSCTSGGDILRCAGTECTALCV